MEVQVDLDSFLLSSSYIKTKFTEQLKLNSKHLKRVVLRRASMRPLSLERECVLSRERVCTL
jgi:hypothetical protein